MNKKSLLEVDFEHLAWKEVDPSITANLSNSIAPIEMARGKTEVYIKANWVDDTLSKRKEIIDFKKIFEYIDGSENKPDGIASKFLGFVTKDYEKILESPANTSDESNPNTEIEKTQAPSEPLSNEDTPEAEPEKEETIDDIINSLISNEDLNELDINKKYSPDELAAIQDAESEDYDPNEQYKYYVINIEEKSIDSGWKDEESAKNRLNSIEEYGAENYSVQKYSTKLFSIVGDPTTIDWKPYNIKPFYVVNTSREFIDSSFDNSKEAQQRLSEISNAINEFDTDNEDSDISIEDTYKVLNKEKTLQLIGLSASYESTFEPIENILKKIGKEIDKALLEAVLSEPQVLSDKSFYIVFGFNPDFSPEDNSNRVGTSEEYSELEIFLDKFVSNDGETVVTSKQLLKASDKLKIKRPYQSTIKMLNHTSDYFYNSLGFGKAKEISGYNPADPELDTNPSPDINNDYLDVIDNSSDEGSDVAFIKAVANGFKQLPKEQSNQNNETENKSNTKKLLEYVKDHYDGDKLRVIWYELNNTVIPYLESIPNNDQLYKSLIEEFEYYNSQMAARNNKNGGHALNTPVTKGTSTDKKPFAGIPFRIDSQYVDLKNKWTDIMKENESILKKIPYAQRYAKIEELFTQKYGYSFKDKLKELNTAKTNSVKSGLGI